MRRLLTVSLISATALATLPAVVGPTRAAAQAATLAPQVQNGPVEHRPVTDIARDLATLGSGATPVWVGWTVPMADGPRDLCNWYSNPSMTVRGFFAEAGQADDRDGPAIAPATGPVPLEAGYGLVVLARVSDGTLDRVRTLSDDCPIDAGGRTVYWLDGVSAARSLAWLDGQTTVAAATIAERLTVDRQQSLANAAVTAIAQHAAPDADRILERIARDEAAGSLRRQAASRMAAYRGASGFETLRRLIADETDETVRRSFVSSLGQTREPGTADALLAVARGDADARTRGDAAGAYLRLAGAAGIPTVMDLVDEADDEMVSRVVSALAALPDGAGVASLITLARSEADDGLRVSVVSALGRSDSAEARTTLLGLARTDPAPRIRGEAAYHYIRAAGGAGVDAIRAIVDADAEHSVKRRAIAGFASLPDAAGIPILIEIARQSQDLAVKKDAVSALTRSDDPRARAFLAEIIRG